ncbi:PQQ-binding-like beta-propeller repeat protein [Streptomyces sp. NPDC093801]|uniref:protein kinase domain-containing protein n=1 Tax=Streptomyces sp. NPDC093801 TaxID=3155203 RepID=UPI00344F0852
MQSLRAESAGFPEYAGQYRLESVLGSGGMGVVHLAASSSGLKLAVKVVHAQHAVDPEFRARFRQEVAAARRVSGAFTAPVVDADPDAERPWMATLFIDAPTLSERVRERVLDAVELTRLAAGLAEALRDIHRAGVVHRDLKPSNVLMAPDGVRVIDFGISRPADSDLRTETGKLIGTPPFMAPEQFQRPREVGTAADVFALGAVLVHAATGRGPFDSDSHYLVAYQVVHSEPDLTGLPARLVPIVTRCLAKDPAERPTAEALIAEVRAATSPTAEDTQAFIPRPRLPVADEVLTHQRDGGTAPAAGPAPEAGPPPKTRRRRPALLAVAAGLALAVTAAGGYLYLEAGDGPSRPQAAHGAGTAQRSAPWTAEVGDRGTGNRAAACSWLADGLYCSGRGLAVARLDPAKGAAIWSVRSAAGGERTAADSVPRYGGGVLLSVASGSRLLQALDPGNGTERWKRTLPDATQTVVAGDRVLLAGPTGEVTALDAATGAPHWTKRIGGVGSVWWSGPDEAGRPALYVASRDADGRSTQLASVAPDSGAERWQLRTSGLLRPAGVAGGAAYLLDDDAAGRTRAVVRVDLATRAQHRTTLAVPLFDAEAAIGPDGTAYAFGTGGRLIAVGPDEERWQLETGMASASRPVFADGRVYLSAGDGRLLAVDAGAGRLVGQTKPRMAAAQGTFSATLPAPVVADGRVYASAPDGTVFALDARNPAAW